MNKELFENHYIKNIYSFEFRIWFGKTVYVLSKPASEILYVTENFIMMVMVIMMVMKVVACWFYKFIIILHLFINF